MDTVYRYFNARTTENRLEADTGIQGSLLVQGYANTGIVGKWVKSTAKEGNACAQLKPVYRLYSKNKNSAYYLINQDVMQVELERGYENQGIVGYAVSDEGLCQANTPIFEFGHKTAGVVQAPSTQYGPYWWNSNGYIYQGVSFAIWSA
ncbi:hypothetical protein TTRE_0000722001 [Trichuris trichiura]|uniref:DUF5648 domain-containing protein n=1 Tax=Trichuris trichiura TaxID=36087 RepID=A0A077ZGG0_TRITR|nr:hypothetical protein TTRE_0000722001 [Trichuris trichiura]